MYFVALRVEHLVAVAVRVATHLIHNTLDNLATVAVD